MPNSSPYRSAAYRKAARAAAFSRIKAEEERTPERIEEDLAAARQRVEELERELADAKHKDEEPVEARLDINRIYARQNGRKGERA
ncbi:hypothetical protein [Halomonas sp. M4R1S46]|uniref:hypothetical protein n=1 Tax=Halomonas sp. M4R1S46 TaxID=2982692 RepID=UPI0021E4701F|nr:hypothetical protein [Halomonas sp. M4R1S46]UYG08390.1 hypothetical protein OCT48_03345 [Halomonas sp. M4R1S46]